MENLNLTKYTKHAKIGERTFGKVFKITENSTGQAYRAKISVIAINDEQTSLISNIKKELNVISQLNHPSILKFIGYSPTNFKQKSCPVFVTEYATNGPLDAILNLDKQSLSPPVWNDTKKLINIYGIASAMSYLHDHEIIHSNLKPSNILEDDYLYPKIADFCFTKIFHPNDTQKKKEVSIYEPPENWNNNQYTKAGDVYSFSMIAYEILTLEEPFIFLSETKYYESVILNGNRPEFKSEVADCYKNLITRCWSQNKDDRPTFRAIVDELKTNENFISEKVDKNEFNEYIEMIEKKTEPSKTLAKVNFFEEAENEVKSLTVFEKIKRIKGFTSLSDEIQNFFQNEGKNQQSIKVSSEKTVSFYEGGYLKTPAFANALNIFGTVSFDVDHSSVRFSEIFSCLSDLKKRKVRNLRVNIITCYLSSSSSFLQDCGIDFDVTFVSANNVIAEKSFRKCFLMKTITIPTNIVTVKRNAFNECVSMKEIYLPSSVSEIGEGAFYECCSLKSFSIPNSVTIVNDFTFQSCLNLIQITIPASLTAIGDFAFDRCPSLIEVTFPSSVASIGEFAFRDCAALKRINFDIHSNLATIGDFAFNRCKALTVISFPPHIASIGEFAFKGCSLLSDISMPYSLTSCGNNAFEGCALLATITIPLTPPIKGRGDPTPVITQIMNPVAPARKNIGIGSSVQIIKSSKCTIF